MCIALCTIVACNIAQNRPDNFPSYPQTITIAPMTSIWGKGRIMGEKKWLAKATANAFGLWTRHWSSPPLFPYCIAVDDENILNVGRACLSNMILPVLTMKNRAKVMTVPEYQAAGSSAGVVAVWWTATEQAQSNTCSPVSLYRKTSLPETSQRQPNYFNSTLSRKQFNSSDTMTTTISNCFTAIIQVKMVCRCFKKGNNSRISECISTQYARTTKWRL